MSIKSILCLFSGRDWEQEALSTAMALSLSADAQLHVLHVLAPVEVQMTSPGQVDLKKAALREAEVMTRLAKEAKDQTRAVQAYVADLALKHQLAWVTDTSDRAPGHRTGVRFEVLTGTFGDCIRKVGRLFDVIVLGHDRHADDAEALLSAVKSTGRPVMVVLAKRGQVANGEPRNRLAFAWDGSLGASRALHTTLPFFHSASEIFVLCVREKYVSQDTTTEARLINYLDLHGLHPSFVHIRPGNKSTGACLVLESKKLHADTLIMGAYGNGYIHEMLFGGATRHVLSHSPCNLVLAH